MTHNTLQHTARYCNTLQHCKTLLYFEHFVNASSKVARRRSSCRLPSLPCFAIACHHYHVLFRICLRTSAFCLDAKGCWRTSVLCSNIHEFLYISHLFHFIYFIVISNFDLVCLTLSSADTQGIAKYARTYIRDTHTHEHTHKK